MSDKRGVQPREGGPYSLYCYDCGEWVPNTANHEMTKEGCFSHSHWCKPRKARERGGGGKKIDKTIKGG